MPTAFLREWKGINNVADPSEIGASWLVTAKNVDIDDAGLKVSRRDGYELVQAGSGVHSVYPVREDAVIYAEGKEIKELEVRESGASIIPAVKVLETADSGWEEPIAYCEVAGGVYFTDGTKNRVYKDGVIRPWGIVPPQDGFTIEPVTDGALTPGQYLVALTYTHKDGRESGASRIRVFDLPEGYSGFSILYIPQSTDPGIETINVYVSDQDGHELYLAHELSAGTVSCLVMDGTETFGDVLSTAYKTNPPSGHIVAYHNGRVYVACDNFIYASEPHNYELFDIFASMRFGSRITMIVSVGGGMYVGDSERVYFIRVEERETGVSFIATLLGTAPVMENCYTTADASIFNMDGTAGTVAVWMSESGVWIGTGAGVAIPLTLNTYHPPIARRGFSFIHESGGSRRFITMLRGSGKAWNTAEPPKIGVTSHFYGGGTGGYAGVINADGNSVTTVVPSGQTFVIGTSASLVSMWRVYLSDPASGDDEYFEIRAKRRGLSADFVKSFRIGALSVLYSIDVSVNGGNMELTLSNSGSVNILAIVKSTLI